MARKIAIMLAEKVRVLNRSSGIIGSATWPSTQMKMPAKTAPMRRRPHTIGSPQFPLCASVRPIRIGTMAAENVPTPSQSIVAVAPSRRMFGSRRQMMYSAIAPIGRLT